MHLVMVTAAAAFVATCPGFDHGHGALGALLARYVASGQVDYAAWKRAGEGELSAYLRGLEAIRPDCYAQFSQKEQLAFWVNSYNAYTIKLMLEHYPVKSIRSIGLLPLAAFRKTFIPLRALGERDLSLDDIENQVLRKQFHEPRIHFAINCASKSCPALSEKPYRAAELEAQLDLAARTFLHDRSKNRYDPAARTLYLSSIFKWFADDFVKAAGSVQTFVARWLEGAGAAQKIEYLDYDWSLNGR
ncbi:MAG TPA: DUF547 domain-containing protein [Polyangia bacterium]|nr:DUF547 domain-containing protein [Polyangia bacterium]